MLRKTSIGHYVMARKIGKQRFWRYLEPPETKYRYAQRMNKTYKRNRLFTSALKKYELPF